MKKTLFVAAGLLLAFPLVAATPEEVSALKQRADKQDEEALHELIRLSADDSNGISGKSLIRYCTIAAGQDDVEAQVFLYTCYSTGRYVPADAEMAQMWKDSILASGKAEAFFKLGKAMQETGSSADKMEGKQLCKRAAADGYEEAKKWQDSSVPVAALSGNNSGGGGLPDWATSRAGYSASLSLSLTRDAHTNSADSLTSSISSQNETHDDFWEEKEDDFPPATTAAGSADGPTEPAEQCVLGYNYQYGKEGLPQSYDKAFYWYKKAADQGYALAQNNLGFCYHNGWGCKKDMKKAYACYKSAAEAGVPLAQSNLGTCYEFGWGTSKNMAEALRWYRSAAAQGNPSAQKHLKRLGK